MWRADRPQKGRFREFWQCDVDTVGSTSPIADAECLAVLHDSLVALGFAHFKIHVNHRAILRGMAAAVGAPSETKFLTALDKLDKIGREGVSAELAAMGVPTSIACGTCSIAGEVDPVALEELSLITATARDLGVEGDRIAVDHTLARGLDYYTGGVWEVRVTEPKIGSLGGGGRYDNLVGMFAGRNLPAVGASLGIDRIAVVMEELGMWPQGRTDVQVWVTVFSRELEGAALQAATAFRRAGIACEVTLDDKKLGKQMKAADQRGVPFAVVVGPDEASAGKVQLKRLATGEQETLTVEEAIARVRAPA